MTARPGSKAPFQAIRVVKASQRLSSTQKLVLMEMHVLDNLEGCYASANTLGDRLGVSSGTIDRVRGELKKRGLVKCKKGRRKAQWNVTLPNICIPSSSRPTPDDIFRLSTQLDEWIENKLKTAPQDAAQHQDPPAMKGLAETQDQSYVKDLTSSLADSMAFPHPRTSHSKTTHLCGHNSKGGVGRLEEVGDPPPPSPNDDVRCTPSETNGPDEPSLDEATPSSAYEPASDHAFDLASALYETKRDSPAAKTSQHAKGHHRDRLNQLGSQYDDEIIE